MPQAASSGPLTAETWVRARIIPCGVCGGQSGTETDYFLSPLVFPYQYR